MVNYTNYDWYVFIADEKDIYPVVNGYTNSKELMDMYYWEIASRMQVEGKVYVVSNVDEYELQSMYDLNSDYRIIIVVSEDESVSYAITSLLWDDTAEEMNVEFERFILDLNGTFMSVLYVLREFTDYLNDNYDVIQVMMNIIIKSVEDYTLVDFIKYLDYLWGIGGYYERRDD